MSPETAEARTTHLPITSAAAAVHPGWVRITHWINVIATFVMITSGWRIYDASPLFGFVIPPSITIGDGLGGLSGALLWHFAAMWLLVINGIQGLTAAFGGYEAARFVHFFAMAAIVCFLAVHLTLAILVPKSLRAMIIGR